MLQHSVVLGILLFSSVVAAKTPARVLMLSPSDDQRVLLKDERPVILLKWIESDPSAKYFLALYLKGKKSTPVIVPVSGGSHRIKLKKVPRELYWMVYARQEGEKSLPVPDGKKNRIDFDMRGVDFKPRGPILRISGFQVRNEFDLDATTIDRSASLSGPLYEASAEIFPPDLKLRYSLNVSYRFSSQKSGENEIEQQRAAIEFGKVLGDQQRIHHQLYVGLYVVNKVDFKLGNNFDTGYDKRLLSGRYLFRGQVAKHLAVEVNTALLMPTSFNVTPSINLKAGPNIKLFPGWWLDLFVLYENYTYKLKGPTGTGDVTIKQTFNGFGAGLTKSW